jgi:hypothetical protein
MKADEDLDLRQEFVRLRREEATTAPTFARTIAAARRRDADRSAPGRWRFTLATSFAAAAALAIWLAVSSNSSTTTGGKAPLEVSLDDWNTQTDYLLEAPGIDLIDSFPDLDDTSSYDVKLTTDVEPRADSSLSGFRRYA